jgi:hypothetical protein
MSRASRDELHTRGRDSHSPYAYAYTCAYTVGFAYAYEYAYVYEYEYEYSSLGGFDPAVATCVRARHGTPHCRRT